MNSKLKIDLTNGTLDVEGSEKFVREIYKEFKDKLDTFGGNGTKKKSTTTKKTPSKRGRKPGRKKSSSRPPQLVKDLNLAPSSKKSLKDVFRSYQKLNRNEKFLVYIDYLKNVAGVSKVSIDHLFTCMKEVGDSVPKLFKQTLNNCKNQKGWIETGEFADITITNKGRRYLNNELKGKTKSKSKPAAKAKK